MSVFTSKPALPGQKSYIPLVILPSKMTMLHYNTVLEALPNLKLPANIRDCILHLDTTKKVQQLMAWCAVCMFAGEKNGALQLVCPGEGPVNFLVHVQTQRIFAMYFRDLVPFIRWVDLEAILEWSSQGKNDTIREQISRMYAEKEHHGVFFAGEAFEPPKKQTHRCCDRKRERPPTPVSDAASAVGFIQSASDSESFTSRKRSRVH